MNTKTYLVIALVSTMMFGHVRKATAILGIGDIVHDPATLAKNVVHFAAETAQWTKEIEQWLTTLERWGDPRQVAADLGFGDYVELYDFFGEHEIGTIEDAFDLAEAWAGAGEDLAYDFHEMFPEISTELPIVGEEAERKFGRFRIENFAEGLAVHYEEVSQVAGEHRLKLEEQLKQAHEDLEAAEDDATVDRLAPAIASLQAEIQKTYLISAEAKQQLDYTLAMKQLQEGKAAKARNDGFAQAYKAELKAMKSSVEQTTGTLGTE